MPTLNHNILEFNPTTVEDVRKEYDLDKPGRMDQAIDILHEWIQKQEHFMKKDFSREYLERIIISTKGSVERAKVRVDKMCTLRTMAPELFENIKKLQLLSQSYRNVYMPKLTEDNYRVYIIQLKNSITSSIFLDAWRHNLVLAEYLKRNDYANGVILVLDIRDNNVMDLIKELSFVDFQKFVTTYTEGFGFRMKHVFVISASTVIDMFTSVLKRTVSDKIGKRITAVKRVEDLHEHVPTELLPEDYGGHQKSLNELYDKWADELSSEEHQAYLKEMAKACTNEDLRLSERPTDEYLGMPGSFKVLNVD